MELLDYLRKHFYTEAELLARARCGETELRAWQEQGGMPQPSYVLNLAISVSSFFGAHAENQDLRFYARGYVSWLARLNGNRRAAPDEVFRRRYLARCRRLLARDLMPRKFRAAGGLDYSALEAQARVEWPHFLSGTYGLCTRTGLPEAIADKEMAIACLTQLPDGPTGSGLGREDAAAASLALQVLDRAWAEFAPHERARSSRQRWLVDFAGRHGLSV